MKKTMRVGKSLIAVQQELGTDEQALAFLEALRWPARRYLSEGNGKVSKVTTVREPQELGFNHEIAIHSNKGYAGSATRKRLMASGRYSNAGS